MKLYRQLLSATLLLVLTAMPVFAQNELRVPLSNPGKPGVLRISSTFSDEIIVRTHSDNDVLFIIDGEDAEDDLEDYSRNGLRRISRAGGGLEVKENGNVLEVRTSSHSDADVEVWVPENFSIKLSSTHGDVVIEGVIGEHEVTATNGDIEMLNISGSAIVNSVNGDIEVEMVAVDKNAPMSFTGLNGDIEVSLPADTKFSGKMKTEYGDVYTNFDIKVDRQSSTSEVKDKDGTYTVVVNQWITGTVNGGGPEYLFKTLHGDIEIRKN